MTHSHNAVTDTQAEQGSGRFPWRFSIIALLLGVWFFSSLGDLWPLADVDLHRDRKQTIATMRDTLRPLMPEVDRFEASARLTVDGATLDYLERELPRPSVQAMIRDQYTLFRYQVFFKKPGDARVIGSSMHPNGRLLGWNIRLLEESPGASLSSEDARSLAVEAIETHLGLQLADWEPKGNEARDLLARRRHEFWFERIVLEEPLLRERLTAVVEGDRVTVAVRQLVVPEAARLASRSRGAPRLFLENVGFLLLGIAGLAAIFVFLNRLRAGQVRLKPATRIAGAAFVCGLMTMFLQSTDRFLSWDPLMPGWIADFQYLLQQSVIFLAIFLLVLVLTAAGDALDHQGNHHRGASLWDAASLRFLAPRVGRDCRNGFLLGLCCGAAMTASIWVLGQLYGDQSGIQPRGFFLYIFNASSPAAATLLFFLGIALVEECGYRFFGGTWLDQWTGKRWLAIGLPAVIYGLTHTSLSFLPPNEPFWGRALTLTLVGCVWGWGFFRFGALAVVISHFTADLFIFNWPRLASGEPSLIAVALATMTVPLLPALFAPLADLLSRQKQTLSGG